MSAIIRLLDAEISKYEALVKNLKASRDAIAVAEALPRATGAKRQGRLRKNDLTNGSKNVKTSSTGRKRGRPRKNAVQSAPLEE